MPSVNDPRHKSIIETVDSFFAEKGFTTSEKTYHDGHLDKATVDTLRFTFSPTALHIRSSADRIAIHPQDGMALYYEAKAGTGKRGAIMVEAMPLATHMSHGSRGVLCLYCCLDKFEVHRGFWTHEVPKLSQLSIPPQRKKELLNWYSSVLLPLFPDVDEIVYSPVSGSGDPFVVIHESVVADLPSWQSLFDAERSRWIANGNSAWESLQPLKDDDQWEEIS